MCPTFAESAVFELYLGFTSLSTQCMSGITNISVEQFMFYYAKFRTLHCKTPGHW